MAKRKSSEAGRNINSTHKGGMRTGSTPAVAPVTIYALGGRPAEVSEEDKEAARQAEKKPKPRRPGGFY